MQEQTTETPVSTIPEDDFAAYERYREGIEPEAAEETSEASEEDKPESADEAEPSEDEEEQEGEPKKHKGGFQRRIDKLTKEKHELEERVRQLAGERPAARPTAALEKPNPEDFQNSAEYFDALADYKLSEREQVRAQQAERQKTVEGWQAQLKDARGRYADYDSIVDADIAITQTMQEAIISSEHGADIAYYLGKNPAEAQRITQLSPVAAVRALGRLEATFATKTAPEPKPVTRAPEPIKPVAKSAKTASPSIHDESLASDFSAWQKARVAQLNRRK